jgi:hypothetical protein
MLCVDEFCCPAMFGAAFDVANVEMRAMEQRVTISLPESLCQFVRQRARAEDRSVAGVIRRCLAEAAKRETSQENRR